MEDPIIQRAIRRVADQRIRAAMEAGEFDGLEGAGRPLPDVDAAYDEQWWVRTWLRREGLERMAATMNGRDERAARAIASIEALRDAREAPDRRDHRNCPDASAAGDAPGNDTPPATDARSAEIGEDDGRHLTSKPDHDP